MSEIIQIVPGLPPKIDGIGDYSLRIAEALLEYYNVKTVFIVCDPNWRGSSTVGHFHVMRLLNRTACSLVQSLLQIAEVTATQPRILVQFAPYGYQKRGCPFWLTGALKIWNSMFRGSVNTMYHELETHDFLPWRSAFWVPPIQRYLLASMASISNVSFTNTREHQNRIGAWTDKKIEIISNFSTVGEPKLNLRMAARDKQILVFGRSWQRSLVYTHASDDLERACKSIGAVQIVDVGDPIFDMRSVSSFRGIPIVKLGPLETAQVSQQMQRSLATFMVYPISQLMKSSVFACSCAHGTIPFVTGQDRGHCQDNEVLPEIDFVSGDNTPRIYDQDDLQELSDRIFVRYKLRNSFVAASMITRLLELVPA